jgi:hypothetical protein
MKKSVSERLDYYSVPVTECGCYIWTGSVDGRGYGKLNVNKQILSAHRLSYEENIGPIPSGLYVLHHCDIPACINPSHLFLGTHANNMADMVLKGRQSHGNNHGIQIRGEYHGGSKLTDDDVTKIRSSSGLLRIIAARFGVSEATVSMIRNHKRWKHIN